MPRRGHHDGDVEIVERTGIEPAAAALQVQLAPLAHASPCAVPTRIELAYRGRQPRILTRGFRDQMGAPEDAARECWGVRRESNPRYEIHKLACDHHTAHTMKRVP